MKRIPLMIFLTCMMYVFAFSQEIIFVSANGNDNNSGLSETEALKTLYRALSRAEQLNSGSITVLGTLDANSEARNTRSSVFEISVNSGMEILITGKPDASGSEKAILSAKGSNKSVVSVNKGNIRFEHIEISNAHGESTGDIGIFVFSRITLGQGAVVKDNNGFGILISNEDAICTIDGGEVRNNNSCAVFVSKGLFVLKSGTITDNKAKMGAGVFVAAYTKFEMQGGIITNNKADSGAGVAVDADAKFEMNGGTITNNTADTGAAVIIMGKGIFEMSDGTITKNRATDSIGGVWVLPGGKFVQSRKAKVSGNTAKRTNLNPNVYRQ
jgi:hypothetical protein